MTAREKWELQRAKRMAEKVAEHDAVVEAARNAPPFVPVPRTEEEIEESCRKAEEWMFPTDNRTNDPPGDRGEYAGPGIIMPGPFFSRQLGPCAAFRYPAVSHWQGCRRGADEQHYQRSCADPCLDPLLQSRATGLPLGGVFLL